MVEKEEVLKYSVFTGIGLALVMAFIIAPSFAGQDTYIFTGGNSGGIGNSTVTSIHAGTGISVNQTTGNVLVSNILPESTVCGNRGTGLKVHVSGTNCTANSLIAGTGISITNTTDDYTFTNTLPEQGCSSAGGTSIWKTASTCDAKGLAVTSPVTLTSNTNDLTIACPTCMTTSNTMQKLKQYTVPASTQKLNQNTGTNVDCIVANTVNTACAEALKTSSSLAGVTVNSISLGMERSGLATGTCTAAVMDSSTNILYTFGTISAASLGTTETLYIFVGQGNYTLSVGEYVGVKCPTQTGVIEVHVTSSTTDVYDSTNSVLSVYGGSWADNTGRDLGSATANFAFRLDMFPYADLTGITKKHLFLTVQGNTIAGNTVRPNIHFNTDGQLAIGTSYSVSGSLNGGGDTTTTSDKGCSLTIGNSFAASDGFLISVWIDNNLSTARKATWNDITYGLGTSSATAPTRIDSACKWDNTTDQISYIGFDKAAGIGGYDTNTILTVWGYD